jgi:hypothetical protein
MKTVQWHAVMIWGKDLAFSCNISVNTFSICTRTQTGVSLSILPLTKAVCVCWWILSKKASSDVKTYGVGAQILSDLGVGKMRILGSPRKLNALKGFGLEVIEYITGGK